jgi:hypothetical protein
MQNSTGPSASCEERGSGLLALAQVEQAVMPVAVGKVVVPRPHVAHLSTDADWVVAENVPEGQFWQEDSPFPYVPMLHAEHADAHEAQGWPLY